MRDIGGNAEDMGEHCGTPLAGASPSSVKDVEVKVFGAPLVLGVAGAADDGCGIFPIYHDFGR